MACLTVRMVVNIVNDHHEQQSRYDRNLATLRSDLRKILR